MTTTTTPPRILLLSFSPLDRDPRVLRQAAFLRQEYDVTAAGFGSAAGQYPRFVRLRAPRTSLPFKALQAARLKTGRFERYYWAQPHVHEAWEKLRETPVDAILANDLAALPLAVRLAKRHGAKVLLDAHEYEPRHFSGQFLFDVFFRPLWDHVARHHLGAVDAMTTACRGIAKLYAEEYGTRPEVLTNAPFHNDIPPSPVRTDAIRMVHHGICNKLRGLEEMIDLMGHLDERFSLDLILVEADRAYMERIRRFAEAASRVRLRAPVPFADIIPTLNGYDVGLCLFRPSTPTMRYALPNKLFEYIQAKLCICSWPSEEIASVVEEGRCGIVSEGFDVPSLAGRLRALDKSSLSAFKDNARTAAQTHCAENNRALLLDLVRRTLSP